MMKEMIIAVIFVFISSTLAYSAANDAVKAIDLPNVKTDLAEGPGKDVTERYCIICHSLDYISMQPKLSRAQWTATVNKMIKTFGGPITEEAAKTIIEYLAAAYGNQK